MTRFNFSTISFLVSVVPWKYIYIYIYIYMYMWSMWSMPLKANLNLNLRQVFLFNGRTLQVRNFMFLFSLESLSFFFTIDRLKAIKSDK